MVPTAATSAGEEDVGGLQIAVQNLRDPRVAQSKEGNPTMFLAYKNPGMRDLAPEFARAPALIAPDADARRPTRCKAHRTSAAPAVQGAGDTPGSKPLAGAGRADIIGHHS